MEHVNASDSEYDDLVSSRETIVTPARPRGRYTIDAVANALGVLNEVTRDGAVTLAQAAAVTGVSKSTAFRILSTLEEAGLVQQIGRAGYGASETLIRWAADVLGHVDVRRVALPWLRRVRDETGETVNLAILRGRTIIYTDVLESESAFRVTDRPGSQVFPHATSLGKAICAHQDLEILSRLLGSEPFPALTSATFTTSESLLQEFAAIRRRGYAIDREERSRGVSCVGAPIIDGGLVEAAVSVAGPTVRMTDDRLHSIGGRLVSVARHIAQGLSPTHVASDSTASDGHPQDKEGRRYDLDQS